MNSSNQRGSGKGVNKSVQKRVCIYCNLTFNGGKALGGHIKIHLKRRKTYCSKQTNKKSMIPQSSQPEDPGHGEEIVDLTKYLSGLRWGIGRENAEDLTQYLSSLQWGVKRETCDLTKYLSRGWRVRKTRGKRERRRSKFHLLPCSKEHKISLKIMERLKRESDREEQEVTSAATRSIHVVEEKKDELNKGGLQGEELVVHGADKEPIGGDLVGCGMQEVGGNMLRGEASKVDDHGFKLLKFDLNEFPPME